MRINWKIILIILIFASVATDAFLLKLNFGKKQFRLDQREQTGELVPDKSLQEFYLQAQSLGPQTSQTQTATFLTVGDIMLSRNVAEAIKSKGDVNLPFENMTETFNSVDFSFGNLESPLGNIIGGHSMVFGAPIDNIDGLINNNFKVLNLANNHAFDQGQKGLLFTKKYLNTLGIQTSGTGENLDEAWTPAVTQAGGLKICFIGASYASVNDNGKTRNDNVARMEDLDKLKAAISNARAICDYVVATMHGGVEYTRKPNELQIKFARAAIDDGADIVIGAHPHWIQTMETYQGKYIFYSLGNFIFDQMFSQETKEGLTLKITISKNKTPAPLGMATGDSLQGQPKSASLEKLELVPVIIENSSTPRAATAEEAKEILEKIGVSKTILTP